MCCVVVGFMALSSHIQMMMYGLMVALIYAIYRAFQTKKWKLLLLCPIIPIVGLCLAGPMIIPFLAHLHQSERFATNWSATHAQTWSMPIMETVGLIAPQVFGILDKYHGESFFKLHSEYLGILPCVFAVVGMIKRKWFWFGMALLFCLVAYGTRTPFGHLMLLLPGYSKFRAVSMSFFVVSFSLCVLAGFGFSIIKNHWLSGMLSLIAVLDLWVIDKKFFHIVPAWALAQFRTVDYARVVFPFPQVYNVYFWWGAYLSLATFAVLTLIFFWNWRNDQCPQ